MLVAYHEGYLLLIKICALFCILVMAYSLYTHLTQGLREKRQIRRIEKLCRILKAHADPSARDQSRTVRRLLSNPMGLLALLTALDHLGWKDSTRIPPKTRWMLCEVLTERYEKRYRRAETYIHGLLITLFIRCDATSSRLKVLLLNCLDSRQPLIRVEALRCICAHRNRKAVVAALERIGRERLPFSNRLITDTLMKFQGDWDALNEELWAAMSRFAPEIQVSVLQLLASRQETAFASRVLELMQQPKTHMEVRIAAMKFFGDVHCPDCVPVLASFLSTDTWEYAVVAAKTLANYDCTGILDALLKGICDRNWYVRTNCATAIVRGCPEHLIERALQVPDRYGRDSVQYALTLNKKEEMAI